MTNNEPTNIYFDIGAVAVWAAAIASILPSIAALLSIIWFLIRIAESATVQKLLGRYAWLNKESTNDD